MSNSEPEPAIPCFEQNGRPRPRKPPEDIPGRSNSPKTDIRPTGFNMTGFRRHYDHYAEIARFFPYVSGIVLVALRSRWRILRRKSQPQSQAISATAVHSDMQRRFDSFEKQHGMLRCRRQTVQCRRSPEELLEGFL